MNNALASAYRWHRQTGLAYPAPDKPRKGECGERRYTQPISAAEALCRARRDVADGRSRYPLASLNPWNPPSERGTRWVENIGQAGLRFAGWADELARIDHRGWYLYPDGEPDEVYRGAVLQLPARNGRPLYVPAYQRGSTGRDGRTWQADDSGFLVSLADAVPGTESDSDWYPSNRHGDGGRDAARAADSLAERDAETERDYQTAWRAGSDYAALGEELDSIRATFRPLYRDHRALVPGTPIMECARRRLHALAERWSEVRAERAELISGYRSEDEESAFREGAGL